MALELIQNEADGQLSLRGEFSDLSLGLLLIWLLREEKTGELLLCWDDLKQQISFESGFPVGTRGGWPENFLGWILRERGYIDDNIYLQSLQEMAKTNKLQGQILLEMGVITPEQLQQALAIQLRRKLVRLFKIENAQFNFTTSPAPKYRDVPPKEIEPLSIISLGIRNEYTPERIEKDLEPLLSTKIRLTTDDLSAQLNKLKLEDDELASLDLLQDWTSVEEFVNSEYLEPFNAKVLLCILKNTDLLEELEDDEEEFEIELEEEELELESSETPEAIDAPPRATAAGSTPSKSSEIPKVTVSSRDTPVRAQARPLEQMRPRIESRPAQTSEKKVKRRRQELVIPPGIALSPEEKAELDEIQRKLNQIRERADYYQLLEVKRDSTVDEIRNSYYKLSRNFHPDRVAGTNLEWLKETLEEIFMHLNEAFSTLTNKKKRAEYDQQLEDPEAQKLKEKANLAAQAEILYAKGKILLKTRKFDQAEEQLKWACQLMPEVGDYQIALAWAIYNNPKYQPEEKKKKALHHLKLAEKYGGEPDPFHYYAALIYKGENQLEKAKEHLVKLLEKNPEHSEGKREYRAVEYLLHRQKQPKENKLWNPLKRKK